MRETEMDENINIEKDTLPNIDTQPDNMNTQPKYMKKTSKRMNTPNNMTTQNQRPQYINQSQFI